MSTLNHQKPKYCWEFMNCPKTMCEHCEYFNNGHKNQCWHIEKIEYKGCPTNPESCFLCPWYKKNNP